MNFRRIALLSSVAALATACAATPEGRGVGAGSARAEGDPINLHDFNAFDATTWKFYARQTDTCDVSPKAARVERATRNALYNTDIMPGGPGDPRWLTKRNMAGPALLDAAEMWPALGQLIANAKYEVDLQWHIIDPDSDGFGEVVAGLRTLNERLNANPNAEPVVVRILYADAWPLPWRVTGFGPPRAIKDTDYASVIRAGLGRVNPKLRIVLASHFWNYTALNVMHVKMAVIDGVTVHLGGGNLSNAQNFRRWRGSPENKAGNEDVMRMQPYRLELMPPGQPVNPEVIGYYPLLLPEHDSAYIMKGEVGQAALAQFDDIWNARETDTSNCNEYFQYRDSKCHGEDPMPNPRNLPVGHVWQVTNPNYDDFGIPADACLPMVFMAKRGSNTLFNQDHRNALVEGMWAAFDSAEHTLKVSSPNANLRGALKILETVRRFEAQGTGTTQVLIPFEFNWPLEIIPVLGGGSNWLWQNILDGAVSDASQGAGRPLDYRWQSLDGENTFKGWKKEHGRHIKYYSVDGEMVLVGSFNLDEQSVLRSREVMIAIDDELVTRQYDSKIFDADFAIGRSIVGSETPNYPAFQQTTPEDVLYGAPPAPCQGCAWE